MPLKVQYIILGLVQYLIGLIWGRGARLLLEGRSPLGGGQSLLVEASGAEPPIYRRGRSPPVGGFGL